MHIHWKEISNVKQFIDDVLHKEASDIPQTEIDEGIWYSSSKYHIILLLDFCYW